MPGVRRLPSGKLQGWYRDTAGRRCYWTAEDRGVTKAQVRAIVARLEDEHRQVRLGYRPARTTADRHQARPIGELVDEYLAWGRAQGGLGGRPWGVKHADGRRRLLAWWQQRLGLEAIADLVTVLPRAEAAARELLAGHSGKTAANHVEALRALCLWAEERGYLDGNPLKGMAPLDTTPRQQRRALTAGEVITLLDSVPEDRRLLYETALASGLRAGELRALRVDDLDTARHGLQLHPEWTKNRRPGFQPLPVDLVARLAAFAATGWAAARYRATHERVPGYSAPPAQPLLYLPSQPGKVLSVDLEAAGIPKWAPAGKVDFHSLRVTYVTLLCESGANIKEVQQLARHATPTLTMAVYARAREDGLAGAVERLATTFSKSCAPGAHAAAAAVGSDLGSGGGAGSYTPAEASRMSGMRPDFGGDAPRTSRGRTGNLDATNQRGNTMATVTRGARSGHHADARAAESCAPGAHDLELAAVIAAWPRLAPRQRGIILGIIEAAAAREPM